MNFWHIQLHPSNPEDFPPSVIKQILLQKSVIGMGEWEEGQGKIQRFKDDVQIGDVFLVRSKGPLALVQVTGNHFFLEEKDVNRKFDWFRNRRKVRVLSWFDVDMEKLLGTRTIDGIYAPNTFDSANNSDFIRNWHSIISKRMIMKEFIDLLKFKKQIVLQGPPGTGKTYTAKEIAAEMTREHKLGSPEEAVDNFFKNFDANAEGIKKRRAELAELVLTFQQKFPKENLKDLTPETYAIGTGTNDSFCWWIERGLKPLGYYFPGSARSYLIYWSKELDDYSTHFKHSEELLSTSSTEQAMTVLAKMISELVLTRNTSSVSQVLGGSFILKLLHSYYPSEYAPINSAILMKNCLKLFGVQSDNLKTLEMNLKIQEIFNAKKEKFGVDITNHEFIRFLFDNFDLKGNIELQANEVLSKGESKLIQFHPAYSYEDFVRGMSAKTNSKGQVEYAVENKILADFAQKAFDNPSSNYVLIIDEINRANLPAVLGELIYALEYRYDENDVANTTVESMYALKLNKEDEDGDRILKLPKNLYIIGTMNTADRSVGHIDYAIRRRFAFVDILPTSSVIDDVVKDAELNAKAKKLYSDVAKLFNEDKSQPIYIQADFKSNDVQLGHSYFLAKTESELKLKLDYEIKPLLNEYLKDGILGESAIEIIKALSV
jgi:5-methylcytosine-specific restriction protein B